eukprot:GILI01002560.1.p1 GENE.GILI01002560.1~~GILI01002560.1.p1  ORF type:complete len:415 (-),score=142.89 GILI01002560.1:423-1562(-)
MSQYWIVSAQPLRDHPEATRTTLKDRLSSARSDLALYAPLNIPDHLKVGTLDTLMSLSDDLAKIDNYVESVLKKIERQHVELEPEADMKVAKKSGDGTTSTEKFLTTFEWDELKYPRNKTLREVAEMVQEQCGKVDEDIRVKAQSYNELKTTLISIRRKAQGNLTQRDLSDVLTGSVINPNDFIETEHATTVVVTVSKEAVEEFQNTYEEMSKDVVPRSALQLHVEDREFTLWRVIVLRRSLDQFKNACKEKRFLVREFHYDPKAAEEAQSKLSQIEAEEKRQLTRLQRVCQASFSDAYIAYVHLKVIRTFVESVLRFGLPVNFVASLVKPHHRHEKKVRSILGQVFERPGTDTTLHEDDDAEFYPYVYLTADAPGKGK